MFVLKKSLGSMEMLDKLIQEYKSTKDTLHTSPKEMWKFISKISRVQKGAEGELRVQKELMRLWQTKLTWWGIIHHDDRFKSWAIQIDHILIYGRALYILETKNWSKQHTEENIQEAVDKTKDYGDYVYNIFKETFPELKTKEIIVTTHHILSFHSGQVEKRYGKQVEICWIRKLEQVIQTHERYWEERWIFPFSKKDMLAISKTLRDKGYE